jgi:hypothetical protein
MTSLASFQAKLAGRASTLQAAFQRLGRTRANLKKTDRFALQEGLTSELWQSWNSFSRSVLIWSLKGTNSASGVEVTSAYSKNSIDEIRFLAMKAARNNLIGTPRPISGDHAEPTWGDLTRINQIVFNLAPSNRGQLLSAFGSSVLISDLQKVRNACAHISPDRITDIRSLQVRYRNNDFLHPSDALFWIEPASGDFSWSAWMDEIRLVAALAVA